MGELKEEKLTPISEEEAVYSLREGYRLLFGQYPTLDSLALLYAQTILETGHFKSIHNYNYGNIKRSGEEDYCMYRCGEIINGKEVFFDPPHRQTWFRAYPDALSGAVDYLKFLANRPRYKTAWEQILKGDPAGFGHALKVAGYYTANEAIYTRTVVNLTNEFKNKAKVLMAWKPKPDPDNAMPIFLHFPDVVFDEPEMENPKNIKLPEPTNIFQIIFDLIAKLFR